MKIKALENFFDLEESKARKAGEEFEVSKERAAALLSGNNKSGRILCAEVPEEKPEAKESKVEKPKRKKAVKNEKTE